MVKLGGAAAGAWGLVGGTSVSQILSSVHEFGMVLPYTHQQSFLCFLNPVLSI